MRPEQQRIAIAEVCGWKVEQLASGWLWTHPNYSPRLNTGCPDYLNDLNAMHEAEKVLFTRNDWSGCDYEQRLKDMTSSWCWHATAAQRAEAFLRTLNLWTPS